MKNPDIEKVATAARLSDEQLTLVERAHRLAEFCDQNFPDHPSITIDAMFTLAVSNFFARGATLPAVLVSLAKNWEQMEAQASAAAVLAEQAKLADAPVTDTPATIQ